jgi:hypothetical protein
MKKMNLQLFSEENPPEQNPPENNPPEETPPPPQKNEPPKENSSIPSAANEMKHLKELVHLIAEKVDKTYNLAKEGKETMAEAAAELKETTGLLQAVIGDMDATVNKVVTAASSLVKLHQAQSSKG